MLRSRFGCRASAGFFSVRKKSGKLRMICDGRPGNTMLPDPPRVHLATPASFVELRVPELDTLYVSSLDVQNAFYNFEVPEWLSELYRLDDVWSADLGLDEVDGVRLTGNTRTTHCLRVLPMDCSWAVFWCQEAHLSILKRAGTIRMDDGLVDFTPPPWVSPAPLHTVYPDNIVFCGLNAGETTSARRAAADALRAARLPVHEEQDGSSLVEVLGMQIDGVQKVVRLTARRRWRLRAAIRGLLERRGVLPAEVHVLVGHLVYAFLLRRPSLSLAQRSS